MSQKNTRENKRKRSLERAARKSQCTIPFVGVWVSIRICRQQKARAAKGLSHSPEIAAAVL